VDDNEPKCRKCTSGRKGCYWNDVSILGEKKGEKKTDKRKADSTAKKAVISREAKGKGKAIEAVSSGGAMALRSESDP